MRKIYSRFNEIHNTLLWLQLSQMICNMRVNFIKLCRLQVDQVGDMKLLEVTGSQQRNAAVSLRYYHYLTLRFLFWLRKYLSRSIPI